jgi:hypothetical protein
MTTSESAVWLAADPVRARRWAFCAGALRAALDLEELELDGVHAALR